MIIGVDIETYERGQDGYLHPVLNAQEFTLGLVKSDQGHKKYFTDPEKMWQYIVELVAIGRKRGLRSYIYGHNHTYDFLGYARKHMFDDNFEIFCPNPLIANLRNEGRDDAYFLDTMSFLKMSLSNVGEKMGLKKLEMPEKVSDASELMLYLDRDVDITLNAILKIKEVLADMGYKPRKLLTAGQVSMNCMMSYLKDNKLLWKISNRGRIYQTEYEDKVRLGYKGARNEAFKIGKYEDCTLVDINSLYPYIMSTMRFPDPKEEVYVENPLKKLSKKEIYSMLGVVGAVVKTPKDIDIPYLAVRFNNTLVFPRDATIRGTWTIAELEKAEKLGYEIKGIDWVLMYKELEENIFRGYFEGLYEKKRTAKGIEKEVVKMLMNSIYGKFAQKDRGGSTFFVERSKAMEYFSEEYKILRAVGNGYLVKKMKSGYKPKYSFPIYSALTTACARDYLYDYLCKVGSKDIIYCDTDSVLFRGNHLEKFEIGDKMGQWKIEAEKQTARVLGEKRYYVGDKVKISGVPTRSRTKELIENLETVTVKKMYGIREVMEETNTDNLGRFREVDISMKEGGKVMMPIPHYIDELNNKSYGYWEMWR